MAWTTPRTWAAGELVTAALMNTHVKDNLDFLAAAPHELWLARVANQSIANITRTAIQWDTESKDVGFGFTPTASTITCQQTGIYTIALCVQWQGAGNFCGIDIDVTGVGTGERAGNGGVAVALNEGNQKACTVSMRVQQNEVISCYAFQSSGAAQNIETSGTNLNAGTRLKIAQVQRRLVS